MISYLQLRSRDKTGVPLFIGVDFESNYTSISKGVDLPPSALTMGHVNDPKYLEDVGEMVANELKSLGINMIFGPVLDTPENVNGFYDTTMANRFFSNNPNMTYILASYYLKGLLENDLIVIAKHFPGYCDLKKNPHRDVPVFTGNPNVIDKNIEIYRLLKDKYSGVMTANYYIDKEKITPLMLDNQLRKMLGRDYEIDNEMSLSLEDKIVITDDFSNMEIIEKYMEGEGYDYLDVAIQAYNAGHDIILYSHFGENGSIGNFDIDDFEKVYCGLVNHIKNDPNAEKNFRQKLYRVLKLKVNYMENYSEKESKFNYPIPILDEMSIKNDKYLSNSDLIKQTIKDAAVAINFDEKVEIQGKKNSLVGCDTEIIKNGISSYVKEISEIKVKMYYSTNNDLKSEVSEIKRMYSESDIVVFICTSKDQATMLEHLYVAGVVNADNTIILNHLNPNVLCDDILKDIPVFSTMSNIKESYSVDLMLLDGKSDWNNEFRINMGANKSINDVLLVKFDIQPASGISKGDIFNTAEEIKTNRQLSIEEKKGMYSEKEIGSLRDENERIKKELKKAKIYQLY